MQLSEGGTRDVLAKGKQEDINSTINDILKEVRTYIDKREAQIKVLRLKVDLLKEGIEVDLDKSSYPVKTNEKELLKEMALDANKEKFSSKIEELIGFVVPASDIDEVTGDITEKYYRVKGKRGTLFAVAWLGAQIFILVGCFIILKIGLKYIIGL